MSPVTVKIRFDELLELLKLPTFLTFAGKTKTHMETQWGPDAVWVLFHLADLSPSGPDLVSCGENTVPHLTAHAAQTAMLQTKLDPKVTATKRL